MSDIICVSNRHLCREDFYSRMEKIAQAHPAGVLLREKDLPEEEYRALAKQVMTLCARYQVPCILHTFAGVAQELSASAFHAPLHILRALSRTQREQFQILGASCHSVEDALEAQALGCTYITAGHVFETDCKKGLQGRGLEFLREVCASVFIPVYAIGGISKDNISMVRRCGAAGACVMSGIMQCEIPMTYLNGFAPLESLQGY